jgi:hypothetical protein
MTDIQYFHDLYTDFERVIASSPTSSRRRSRARWGVAVAAVAVAAAGGIIFGVSSLTDSGQPQVGAGTGSPPSTGPSSPPAQNPPGTTGLGFPGVSPLAFSHRVTLAQATATTPFAIPVPNAPAANRASLSGVFVPNRQPTTRRDVVTLVYAGSKITIGVTSQSGVWADPTKQLRVLVTKKGVPAADIIQLPSGPALMTPSFIRAFVSGSVVTITSRGSASRHELLEVAASLAVPSSPGQSTPTAFSPVNGVVRVDGGAPHPDRSGEPPLRDARIVITGTTASGVTLVRRLTADGEGRFAAKLPSGRYTVTALAYGPASRPLDTQPQAVVTVTGRPVRLRLTSHLV